MTDNVKPFPAERIDAGYDTYAGDFRAEYVLAEDSQNLTVGFNLGTGPRFGMAPIPGHSDTETATNSLIGGLMAAEASSNALGMRNRVKILGVIPVKVGSWSDPNTKKIHYIWITAGGSFTDNTKSLLSASFNAERNASTSTLFEFIANSAKGIGKQTSNVSVAATSPVSTTISSIYEFYSTLGTSASQLQHAMESFLGIDAAINYASFASLKVSARPQPNEWIVGTPFSGAAPSATDPGNFTTIAFGATSAFNLQNFPNTARPIYIYGLDSSGNSWLEQQYIYTTKFINGTYYKKSFYYDIATTASVQFDTVASDAQIAPTNHAATVANIGILLLHDPCLTVDNGYQFIGVAAKKAYAFFLHDWDRGDSGTTLSCIDLTNNLFAPADQRTLLPTSSSFYTEYGIQALTCFARWPAFSATPLPKNSATSFNGPHVTLGAAGSGILRANTAYEVTYSIYNKKLNMETNVGTPAKILTDSEDFVALSVYRDIGTGTPTLFDQVVPALLGGTIIPQRPVINNNLNNLEIRFYYREIGAYEWLPALFIDAAQFFYYPNFQVLWACEGTAVGTVGGQPGGFNDYSPLPNEQYTCCVAFKSRMFWLSPQNMHWSLTNNPIAYSINNTYAAPGGEFRGAIIHQFRGESDLESQLIVFGSKEVYFGDFTGEPIIQSVQISADNVAQFPVDGSDFVLQTMTTNTAFSYRSAVSADGDLYYWGPQGIFVRRGTAKPEKISLRIEPELASLYDSTKIDEIHCVYDSVTRQITWFYPPKVADADNPTYGLSLDIDTDEFFPLKYAGKIDGSQKLTIENDDSPTVAQGDRTIVFSRASTAATVQRAYFYDHFCKSGDIYPGQEMLVKSFSTPATGQRTFTLASGYDNTLLSSIVAGDLVGVVGSDTYATSLTHAEPFIGTVVSVGVGTITLKLPDGVSFDASGSLTEPEYFQLYVKNIHSFLIRIATKYWTPGGMLNYWFFLYLYGLFKLNPLLPSRSSQDLTIGYTTPLNSDNFESTLALRDNSRGNYQVYKALVQSHGYAQAIRFIIEEDHYAGSWVLQSLILMAQQQSSDEIKTYEE